MQNDFLFDDENIAVNVHEGCVVSGDLGDCYASREYTARATIAFNDHPWFSDVAILGDNAMGDKEEWMARVLVFFSRKRRNGDSFKLAFVRFFMELQDIRALIP